MNNTTNVIIYTAWYCSFCDSAKALLNEKKITQQKIIINNLKKNKAEEKTIEYKKHYLNELEKKNFN